MKLGNYQEAEKYLKKASVILPFNNDINAHLKELSKSNK